MSVYDEFFYQAYNTFLTCSPLATKACLDWDVNPDRDGEEFAWTLPKLYYIG